METSSGRGLLREGRQLSLRGPALFGGQGLEYSQALGIQRVGGEVAAEPRVETSLVFRRNAQEVACPPQVTVSPPPIPGFIAE